MCGICGVVQVTGTLRDIVEPARLDAMTDVMTHRGPDDRGVHLAPGIGIGVRRLSIVDVEGGHQPVTNERGTIVAAQNGELYNHLQLRRELESDGHVFQSQCDTEVLPHLYERHGPAFVEKLRGKFGLVVWDHPRRRAVIARDRLGVKPLYWAVSDDRLVFASELKSVLTSGLVGTSLDADALDEYLTLGYVPAPKTPLRDVRKLLPGHALVVENGEVREEPYWLFPAPEPEPPGRDLDDYADELLELLGEAVRLRLMSDVPLGAMLSGGLDSSLIVALMAEMGSGPVETFSVGFREDGDLNELPHARRVAEAFGCNHHDLELSLTDAAVELSDLVWYLDEPVAELSAVGFLALSRLATQHVTVALSGQGADELFGGYRKHRVAGLLRRLDVLPLGVRRLLGQPLRLAPDRLARLSAVLSTDDPVARQLAMSGHVDAKTRADLYAGPLAGVDAAYGAVSRVLDGARGDALLTSMFLDGQLALVDNMLHYFDRMSMAASLEVRVPSLDHVLVEWASRLPSRARVDGRLTTKVVLRRAAARYLPPDIIGRPKVGFFRNSAAAWLRAQLNGEAGETLLDRSRPLHALLDSAAIEQLVREFRASNRWEGTQLVLAMLVLDAWLADFLPRATATNAAVAPW